MSFFMARYGTLSVGQSVSGSRGGHSDLTRSCGCDCDGNRDQTRFSRRIGGGCARRGS